jgi:hypothetical protein
VSFCDEYEGEEHEAERRARVKRAGFGTPALLVHDLEQAWRAHGEEAIRVEMVRRLIARGWGVAADV